MTVGSSWAMTRCLPSTNRRTCLVGAVATLGTVVLLRVMFMDTFTNGSRDALQHGDSVTEWTWSALPQTSRVLEARIRREMQHPSTGAKYNLTRPAAHDFSQNRQSCLLASLFGDKSHQHTFLEAGAYNGEDLSNSLYLEREMGWTGLLVEPDPWNYWALKKRSRKVPSLNACLAPQTFASKQKFKQSDTMSRLSDSSEVEAGKGIFSEVICYPLYSVLRAANLTTLDYLALDLEGLERKVLETLPWDKINIKVIQVEASHLNQHPGRPRKNKGKVNTFNLHKVSGKYDRVKRKANMKRKRRKALRNSNHLPNNSSCDGFMPPVSHDNIKLNPIQRQLNKFFKSKGYELLTSIGEDLIFTRLDFVSNPI